MNTLIHMKTKKRVKIQMTEMDGEKYAGSHSITVYNTDLDTVRSLVLAAVLQGEKRDLTIEPIKRTV